MEYVNPLSLTDNWEKYVLLIKEALSVTQAESWEKDNTKIAVEGYKWFGNPRGFKIVRDVKVVLAF